MSDDNNDIRTYIVNPEVKISPKEFGSSIPRSLTEGLVFVGSGSYECGLLVSSAVNRRFFAVESASSKADQPSDALPEEVWVRRISVELIRREEGAVEVVEDSYNIETSWPSLEEGGRLSLRDPVILNGAVASVEDLHSALVSAVGMSRMQILAAMTAEETKVRAGWLDSVEKVEEFLGERESDERRGRLNRVRVEWGPDRFVICEDSEDIMQRGVKDGVLHCPQARSDDEAYSIGMMFVMGEQDPGEFPLIVE